MLNIDPTAMDHIRYVISESNLIIYDHSREPILDNQIKMSRFEWNVIDSSPVEYSPKSLDGLMKEEFRNFRQKICEDRDASPTRSDHNRSTSSKRHSRFSPSRDRKEERPRSQDRKDTEERREPTKHTKITQTPEYIKICEHLCWRCGKTGHSRKTCINAAKLFCSRCGLVGILTRACLCKPRSDPKIRKRANESQLARIPDPFRAESKSVHRHRPTILRSEENSVKRAVFELAKLEPGSKPVYRHRPSLRSEENPPKRAAVDLSKFKTTKSIGIQCEILRTPAYLKLRAIPPEVFFVVCRDNTAVLNTN
ncbi:uncharacterized protein LOC123676222 isoform X1 [Harmonia axyridis]|uniref:uncharacterized protein LOC123676222 isoform X1 n=1 Tax=Harmonia axyridis TaxID=115357 RepID=UPI001E27817F|nr:uncharacterized protein LOC123676222 isoform X1 [Harmonia axyridis]